nr:hypothetical protein BaRGS_034343 [Batillaria attramentaria]
MDSSDDCFTQDVEAAYDDPAEVGAAGDAESEDPEEGFHGDGERQDTDGNVVGSTSKVGAEDTAETGNGSSADSALKRYDNVSDLFEDVAQETKMILIQLAQSFRESEEYEGACVSELEKLASEAVDLEKMVSQQKDLLRHRLAMIGRRLEQGEEQD